MDGVLEARKSGLEDGGTRLRWLQRRVEELIAENAVLRAKLEGLTGQVEELKQRNAELEQRNAELEQRNAELEQRNAALTKELSKAQRAGKRQAAPFRRKKRKTNPKRPGRKAGHKGEHRAVPDKVDRTLEGPPLKRCPDCAHAFDHGVHTFTNYETDLPPVEPQVTRFRFKGAWCPNCKRMVYAPHPEQTSTAIGAAASHLGPRARSFMVDLKHRLGVPYGKLKDVLETHFDLKVSPGGIVQASYRLTELARPTFEALQKELARSDLVHADETGWRVQSESWWMWVACTERLTVYRITDHRSAKVIKDILGPNFGGRLFRDGWASYDKQLEGWSMLRCVLHLKHNAEDLLKQQSGANEETPRLFLDWFDDLLALKKAASQWPAHVYAEKATELEAWWEWMVEHVRLADENERNLGFRERMAAAQGQILPILREAGLPAANNRAEQQIRPGVVIRKISAGNKTERGAQTHEVLASLAATCRQQGIAFANVVRRVLLGPSGEAVHFWHRSPVPS